MGCVGQRKPTDAPRNFRPRLADPPRILPRSVTGKLNAILPALEGIPLPQRQSLCVCKAEVIITHARYVKKFIANLLLIDFGFNFDFDFVGPATGSGVGYPHNGSPLTSATSFPATPPFRPLFGVAIAHVYHHNDAISRVHDLRLCI
jgi:hypothetical protein